MMLRCVVAVVHGSVLPAYLGLLNSIATPPGAGPIAFEPLPPGISSGGRPRIRSPGVGVR